MNVSRRDFTRLGALSFASQFAARLTPQLQAQPATGPKVGYCIIGLGRIADHFMRGIQDSPNSRVAGLVSGHREKAEAIAAEYGIPKTSIYSYESMDSMRDNKQIDAVYVALPNSMHAEYTIRSAKAGKHVLCEKPMATTVADAQAMIDACQVANVKLMIAYRLHFETTNLTAIQLIRSGAFGQIQSIQSSNGFNCGASEWRLQKALAGGGPLMDVGIYSLNAARYLTGEEPTSITAYASSNPQDPRFREVEENVAWIMKFPSGVVASCNTTYGASMDGRYRVYGSKGWLEATPAFIYEGLHLKAHYTRDGAPDVNLDLPNSEKDPTHFTKQANHFSECIQQNLTPKTPGKEGLHDMQYMREIYHSAGIMIL